MTEKSSEQNTTAAIESLTWSEIKDWTTANYDLGYDVHVKYQPGFVMDHQIGSSFYAEGKPYSIWLNYWVIGHNLFIWSKRPGKEFEDLHSKQVIDLRKLDLMTQPIITRKQLGIFFTSERPVYAGEQFYFSSNDPTMTPYLKAFVLKFPESEDVYQWEDAVKFSASVKRRVHKLREPVQPSN